MHTVCMAAPIFMDFIKVRGVFLVLYLSCAGVRELIISVHVLVHKWRMVYCNKMLAWHSIGIML